MFSVCFKVNYFSVSVDVFVDKCSNIGVVWALGPLTGLVWPLSPILVAVSAWWTHTDQWLMLLPFQDSS